MHSENAPLRILCIADLHGAAHQIAPIIEDAGSVDLILLAGDITHFGKRREAEAILALLPASISTLAVPGNCDHPEIDELLNERAIGLHGQRRISCGYPFIGLGTSLPCPGRTPYESTDEQLGHILDDAVAFPEAINHNSSPFLLLTHQPPFRTCNDRAFLGKHVGSKRIRTFIEHHQPLVCFCGHIHEGACIDTIGETQIVNAGPAKLGNYTLALLGTDRPQIFLKNCHTKK